MLDLKFVRENPDIVKQNIKNKFQDRKLPLVDEVIELDAKARATQTEADELRANRNKLSKQIGALMAQGKKEEAEAVKAQVSADAATKQKKAVIDGIRSLEQMPKRYPFFNEEYIPPNKYRKMFIKKWYLILYQIQEDVVYVDYILDYRKDYQWLDK